MTKFSRNSLNVSNDKTLNFAVKAIIFGLAISLVFNIIRLFHIDGLFIFLGNTIFAVGLVALVVYAIQVIISRSRGGNRNNMNNTY